MAEYTVVLLNETTQQFEAMTSPGTSGDLLKSNGTGVAPTWITPDYQTADAALTSIAGLSYVSDSFIKLTAADTYAVRTIEETRTDLSINNVDNVSINSWAGSSNIETVGVLDSGSITSGFGNIDVGASNIDGGTITADTALQALVGGFGITRTEGTVHIQTASAGAVTANTSADELVVEHSGTGGISILTPDASWSSIYFGSPSNNYGAELSYSYNASKLVFGTAIAGFSLEIVTGAGAAALTLDSSQNATFAGTVGLTGSRVPHGYFTDLTVTNTITGEAATVATIDGLAPNTATTQATQGSITSIANLVTVGTIGTGVWEATDVGVAHGGTGKSSWTQYLLIYADTTTSLSQIAIGTDGQILTSGGAGFAPSFQDITGTVDVSGDPVQYDYARFTDADTIEGRSYSEMLGDISGQAAATFSWNSQNLTSVGTIASASITTTDLLTINQSADSDGAIIYGHDDVSAKALVLNVNSNGYAVVKGTTSDSALMFADYNTYYKFHDNAGAYYFYWWDSDEATVASLDSDGYFYANYISTETATIIYDVNNSAANPYSAASHVIIRNLDLNVGSFATLEFSLSDSGASGERAFISAEYGGSDVVELNFGTYIGTTYTEHMTIKSDSAIAMVGVLGVGLARTEGTVHIHTASAGTVTAVTTADDLVVENSDNVGISMLSADAKSSALVFGSESENQGAWIDWGYSIRSFNLGTRVTDSTLKLYSGNVGLALTLDSTQNVHIENDLKVNTDALVVDTKGGRVGIGTASPAAKLGVVGLGQYFALKLTNTLTGDGLHIETAVHTSNTGIIWDDGSNNLFNVYSTDDAAILVLYDEGVADVTINTEGDSWFNGGQVGIGTDSPGAKLDIVGDGVNFALEVNNTLTGDGIFIETATDTTNNGIQWYDGVNSLFNLYTIGDSAVLVLSDGGVADVTINTAGYTWFNGGNVGIGTNTPASALEVNGGVNIGGTAAISDNNLNVVGTLTVGATSTINGNLDVNGSLETNNNLAIKNTTSVDGISGTAYLGFKGSSGTEYGWIGDGGATTNDIALFATVGNATVRTYASGKSVKIGDYTGIDILVVTGGLVAVKNNLTVNSNYAIEGYSTGRNVERNIYLNFERGSTPGTDINIIHLATNGRGFNEPTISNATDMTNDGAGPNGSFYLSNVGTLITMGITETIIGVGNYGWVGAHLINSASDELYTTYCEVVSGELTIKIYKQGSATAVDWRTILDSGDSVIMKIQFWTST